MANICWFSLWNVRIYSFFLSYIFFECFGSGQRKQVNLKALVNWERDLFNTFVRKVKNDKSIKWQINRWWKWRKISDTVLFSLKAYYMNLHQSTSVFGQIYRLFSLPYRNPCLCSKPLIIPFSGVGGGDTAMVISFPLWPSMLKIDALVLLHHNSDKSIHQMACAG